MLILAVESSGMAASCALAQEDRLIAEYTVNYRKTHSQTLLPMIDDICRMVALDQKQIDAVAVSEGPGSFTGLRIGSATAKGIGLALDIPLIGVPTLEVLACNAWGVDCVICPMMDARREQVYTAAYCFEEDNLTQIIAPDALPVEEMIGCLNQLGRQVYLIGDGTEAYRQELCTGLTVPFRFAPMHMNAQRAGALARRAFDYLRDGKTQSAAAHRPDYLRKSQAEQERERRCRSTEDIHA